MRITGGAARGIPLRAPAGYLVRPATDALRQAVFSSLGARVVGSSFLDLFAGTGGYGLEALSRGARAGTFVEKSPRAAECLRGNLAAVRKSLGVAAEPRAAAIAGAPDVVLFENDAVAGRWPEAAPDLIFADPPYEIIANVAARIFARLLQSYPAAEEMVVVFEMPGEIELAPPGWTLRKRLGKGARQPTAAIFLRG